MLFCWHPIYIKKAHIKLYHHLLWCFYHNVNDCSSSAPCLLRCHTNAYVLQLVKKLPCQNWSRCISTTTWTNASVRMCEGGCTTAKFPSSVIHWGKGCYMTFILKQKWRVLYMKGQFSWLSFTARSCNDSYNHSIVEAG